MVAKRKSLQTHWMRIDEVEDRKLRRQMLKSSLAKPISSAAVLPRFDTF
jgi:hypothetical protein